MDIMRKCLQHFTLSRNHKADLAEAKEGLLIANYVAEDELVYQSEKV